MQTITPEYVVRALGGRATYDEIVEHVGRGQLRSAVAAGRLVRAARGRYRLPELPDAIAAAAAVGGVLCRDSAAAFWGLPLVKAPAAVHVVVPHGAHRAAPAGVVLHQTRDPDLIRLVEAPRPEREPATDVVRTVLDCATALPFPEALAVADSALSERYVTHEQLVHAAEQSRGPGRALRRRIASAADAQSANPFESALRGIVLEQGFTGFVAQCPVRVRAGTWHVDVGDAQRRVALEADSFAHHGTRGALVADCERYDEIVLAGWLLLRFAWEHVVLRPAWVADVVRRACHERPPAAA